MNDKQFFVQRSSDGASFCIKRELEQVYADAYSEADAQRVAACINACEGVPTEVLNDVNSSERELLHHYVEASKQLGECSGGFETLTKEVAALKEENQKLRDTLANPFVTGVNIGNGSLEVGFEGAGAHLMAGMFEGQLDDPRAVNYIEARFASPRHGQVVVTVQKLSGLTPTQKLTAAEADLSGALAALRALTDWCRDNTSPTQANTPHALVVTASEVLLKHGAQ